MDIVALEMTRILQNEHYARMPFNEELSERFLERFLDELGEGALGALPFLFEF